MIDLVTITELRDRAEGRQLPATVSVAEAARLLGLSRRVAYEAAKRGDIPTVRFGRKIVVPASRLLALLDGGE